MNPLKLIAVVALLLIWGVAEILSFICDALASMFAGIAEEATGLAEKIK